MIFSGKNHVLLVDDEADVLAVSKLALKNVQVYGIENQIHSARSKEEAIAVYDELTTSANSAFVMTAFVDVVMETDYAGLEFCKHVRQVRQNKYTPLYVRTGQPGTAPERQVMDEYDINGYFSKAESTEDKLYSLLKAGVRQFYYGISSMGLGQAMVGLSEAHSRAEMTGIIGMIADAWQSDETGQDVGDDILRFPFAFNVGGDDILRFDGFDPAELAAADGMPLSATGDKFVVDEAGNFLMKIAGDAKHAETFWYGKTYYPVPEIVGLWYGFNRVLSSLWLQRA